MVLVSGELRSTVLSYKVLQSMGTLQFISLPVVYTEHVSTVWVPSPHYRQVVWGMFLHICSLLYALIRLLQCVDTLTPC